jgi:hypothetical protein
LLLLFIMPNPSFVCISDLPHVQYIPCPSHCPWFDPNILWRVQIVELHIMKLPVSSSFSVLNTFLYTLLSDIVSMCYLSVWQIKLHSHAIHNSKYNSAYHILIWIKFRTSWQQVFPECNMITSLLWMQFLFDTHQIFELWHIFKEFAVFVLWFCPVVSVWDKHVLSFSWNSF